MDRLREKTGILQNSTNKKKKSKNWAQPCEVLHNVGLVLYYNNNFVQSSLNGSNMVISRFCTVL